MRVGLGFLTSIFFAWSTAVYAQMTFDGCLDIRGRPVASIPNNNLNDVAVAMLSPNDEPLILYNPYTLSWLQPQTQQFFYYHECAHHALGHVFISIPTRREQEADCWAMRTLYERVFDDEDVTIVQNDLARIGKGDWTHLPGPRRAINLRECLY